MYKSRSLANGLLVRPTSLANYLKILNLLSSEAQDSRISNVHQGSDEEFLNHLSNLIANLSEIPIQEINDRKNKSILIQFCLRASGIMMQNGKFLFCSHFSRCRQRKGPLDSGIRSGSTRRKLESNGYGNPQDYNLQQPGYLF